MNNVVIRKVKVLQGEAKAIAEKYDLEPDDLVILEVSLEKVIGDPVSYLLSKMKDAEFSNPKWNVTPLLRPSDTMTKRDKDER